MGIHEHPQEKNIHVSCSSFRPDGQYILDHELGSVMAPLLGKRPNMPLSIWRCQPKEEEDDDDIYIYMYKLTYINDVCIYLTLFIY